jgi:hypothetical protein
VSKTATRTGKQMLKINKLNVNKDPRGDAAGEDSSSSIGEGQPGRKKQRGA